MELPVSISGYTCPKCGESYDDSKTLQSKTDTVFNDGGEFGDPHLEWTETHKCWKCETLYLIHNGT